MNTLVILGFVALGLLGIFVLLLIMELAIFLEEITGDYD